MPSVYRGYRRPRDNYRAARYAVLAVLAIVVLVAAAPFVIPRDAIAVRGIVKGQSLRPDAFAATDVVGICRDRDAATGPFRVAALWRKPVQLCGRLFVVGGAGAVGDAAMHPLGSGCAKRAEWSCGLSGGSTR